MNSERPLAVPAIGLLFCSMAVLGMVPLFLILNEAGDPLLELRFRGALGLVQLHGPRDPTGDIALLLFLYCGVMFLSGIGLMRFQERGRWGVMIQSSILVLLVLILNFSEPLTGAQVGLVLSGVLIVAYLNQSHIRGIFAEATRQSRR